MTEEEIKGIIDELNNLALQNPKVLRTSNKKSYLLQLKEMLEWFLEKEGN